MATSLLLSHALLHYTLLLALIVEAQALPPSTFCGDKPDGLFANPLSCSSFWACWNNGLKGSLLLCPPNTIWSHSFLSCTHTTPPSPFPFSSSTSLATPSANTSASNTSVATPTSSSSSSFNASSFTSSSTSSPPVNASSTALLSNSSSASNSSMAAASFSPSCTSESLHLPIWRWNGLLQCYGYGCLNTQKPNLRNQFDIGVPCLAAQALISIAKRSTQAWIPAPHQFLEGDLNLAGGKHWKIRFDSLETEADSGLTLLKASITDYSPSQKILDSWQGGPKEAQFALKGPQTSPQGECYYSLSLESPDLGDMWEPFTRDLIKESQFKQRQVGLGSLLKRQQALQGEEDSFGWVHKKRGGNKRRVHTGADSVQGCLKVIPWASLVATALCYASNSGGGLNSVALCSDIPSPDLFTIAKCFSSFMGIGSELGL